MWSSLYTLRDVYGREEDSLLALAAVTIALAALWLAGPLKTMLNKNNNTIKHIDINKLPIVRVEIPIPKHTCKSWYCDYDWRVWGTFNRKYIIMLNNSKPFKKVSMVSVDIVLLLHNNNRQTVKYMIHKPIEVRHIHIAGICSYIGFGYADHWITNYSLNIDVTYRLIRLDVHNCTEEWIITINNTWKRTYLISFTKNGTDKFIDTKIGPIPTLIETLSYSDVELEFKYNLFCIGIVATAVGPTDRPMTVTILKLH